MTVHSRRSFLLASAGAAAASVGATALLPQGLRAYEFSGHALGTTVRLTAVHPREADARAAVAAAFAELDRLEDIFSLYRADSDVCRLNRTKRLDRPPPELVAVLRQATAVSQASAGAFDITVQPLWQAYRKAQQRGALPADEEIAAAQGCVDWRNVACNERLINLYGEGTEITLNGIAQGYAADRVLTVLRAHGVKHALIDTGELHGTGTSARGTAWQCGVQHPRADSALVALAQLDGRLLATSGDYETAFSPDLRHHHLLDPATGISPTQLCSVSVAAPSAMLADALSTACFVLGTERSRALLRQFPGTDALFVTKDQRVMATAGFPQVAEEEQAHA